MIPVHGHLLGYHEHVCPRCAGWWTHGVCNTPEIKERLDPRCEAIEADALAEADSPTAPTPDDSLEGDPA